MGLQGPILDRHLSVCATMLGHTLLYKVVFSQRLTVKLFENFDNSVQKMKMASTIFKASGFLKNGFIANCKQLSTQYLAVARQQPATKNGSMAPNENENAPLCVRVIVMFLDCCTV